VVQQLPRQVLTLVPQKERKKEREKKREGGRKEGKEKEKEGRSSSPRLGNIMRPCVLLPPPMKIRRKRSEIYYLRFPINTL
jgi:hypothetical protein